MVTRQGASWANSLGSVGKSEENHLTSMVFVNLQFPLIESVLVDLFLLQ